MIKVILICKWCDKEIGDIVELSNYQDALLMVNLGIAKWFK